MRTTITACCVLLTIFSVAVISSCKKEKGIDPLSCRGLQASFAVDVLPVVETRCSIGQCHVQGGVAPYIATDYNGIMPYAADGRLLRAIKHEGPSPMPRLDPMQTDAVRLPDALVKPIECWVNQGFPNN